MSLSTLYRCTRSLEAIENYAIATNWQSSRHIFKPGSLENRYVSLSSSGTPRQSRTGRDRENFHHQFYEDRHFWDIILTSPPNEIYGHSFHFYYCALSEWVARVPGLLWSKGAKALQELAESAIELKSAEWTVYHLLGKSQRVLGGIGTLKFSPDVIGNRLATLSCGHNASSGVPVIISSEIWEHYELREGDILSGEAKWQEIPLGWAERFPSIRGIPRGVLVIRHPSQINVIERNQPIQFHPCTVMEYDSGNAILYDFVYATEDTSVRDYRQRLEGFFEGYKAKNERYGRYLIPADQSQQPLFDIGYTVSSNPDSQSQLRLIEERVRLRSFKGQTIDELLQVLASNCSNDDLQALSRDIRLNPNVWFTGASAARSAVQLLDVCIQRNKEAELVDALSRQKSALVV
jgi:hypothetical protein